MTATKLVRCTIIALLATLAGCEIGSEREAQTASAPYDVIESMDMAIRLSKAFGLTAETWLGMRIAHDLWQARGRIGEIKVERIEAA